MKRKKVFPDGFDMMEDALRDIMGDDEDAIQDAMEDDADYVIGHRMETEQIASTGFAQVGRDDYYDKQRFEGKWLIDHIRETLGDEPTDSRLGWKGFPHDFGTYHEITYRHHSSDAQIRYLDKLYDFDFESCEEAIQKAWDEQELTKEVDNIIRDNEVIKGKELGHESEF